jgi:hypothetical protein
MNQLTNKFDATTGDSNGTRLAAAQGLIDSLARVLIRLGILKEDLDYHLIRASMVIIFLFFGYQKWFQYEADVLVPLYQQRPSYFLVVSGFRHSRGHLVFGGLGMDLWYAFVSRVLE